MINSIVIELRPRLQSCNVFISTEPSSSADPVRLTIGLKSISLNSGSNYQLFPFNGLTLIPSSISSLQVERTGIFFRLQTQPNTISGSFKTEVISLEPSANLEVNFVPDVEPYKPLFVACRCCGYMLSKGTVTFNRVLPLPSAEWETGDWFCHQHHTCSTADNGLLEGQRVTDCLYGQYFVQISNVHLVRCDTRSKVLHCSKCLSWLGTNSRCSSKVWNCTTQFVRHISDVNNTVITDFFKLVKRIVSECLSNTCKIVLSCNISESSNHHLLLWIMEKHLELLVGVQNLSAIDSNSKRVLKVLFSFQTEHTNLLSNWLKDPSTQNVYVAKQMLLQGLQHLKAMSALIPHKFQVSNDMYVSYICDSSYISEVS